MAKELPYFRFTPQEWQNGLISLEDYDAKGLFIDVCAYYWVQNCSITKAMLERRFRNDIDLLNLLFKNEILAHDKKTDLVCINYLNEQFDVLSERRKRRQVAGSKGGKQRSSNAKAMLKQSSSYKDKDKDKDNIPAYEDFKAYALTKKPKVSLSHLRLKYDSWIENGWNNGNGKPIKNWKSSLLNTLQYIEEDNQKTPDNGLGFNLYEV